MKKSSHIPTPALLSALATLVVCLLGSHPATAASDIWTGGSATSLNWTDPANWAAGTAPVPGDQISFTNAVGGEITNDFVADTAFDGLTFKNGAGSFTLDGNRLMISGAAIGNVIAITNAATSDQVINADVSLDWGVYTFRGYAAYLDLNDVITLNRGGVAYFNENAFQSTVQSTFTNDSTGLISGLGAAGLMFQRTTSTPNKDIPTGFASAPSGPSLTMLQKYDYTSDPNAQTIDDSNPTAAFTNPNVLINFSTSVLVTNTLTSNTYVNTILQSSTVGTNYTIITATNANLVLGQTGAILAPCGNLGVYNSSSTYNNVISVYGAGTISAGGTVSNRPGTLILGINGSSGGTSGITINSKVVDNGTNGPVTVIKLGSGLCTLSVANAHSGGTYVNQGYLALNSTTALGTGPVYISPTASLLSWTGETLANNDYYLGPGAGVTSAPLPASLVVRNAILLGGTIHLQGSPVTYPGIGDRVGMEKTNSMTFQGMITGSGTLDLSTGASAATAGAVWAANNTPGFIFNNTNANNNWTGGLIVNALTNSFCYTKLFASSQLASNSMTLVAINKTNRFDLNGFNDTIGGLTSILVASTNLDPGLVTNIQVANFGTNASTLAVGAGNASATFAGSILDGGAAKGLSIVKIGTGIQTFSGPCTYSGSTVVSGGTLVLSNSASTAANSAIAVGAGATLDVSLVTWALGSAQDLSGSGTVAGGSATLVANGTVHPGGAAGVGTLAFTGAGGLTLAGTANVTFDLGGSPSGPGNDQITVAGPLTLAGTLTINSSSLAVGTYTLITCSGTPTGNATVVFTGGSTPSSYSLNKVAGAVTLTVTAVTVSHPDITSVTLTPTQIVMQGTNGPANGNYYVLTSTNVQTALANWQRLATNQFDGTGKFNWTNVINSSVPREFYRLQVQ